MPKYPQDTPHPLISTEPSHLEKILELQREVAREVIIGGGEPDLSDYISEEDEKWYGWMTMVYELTFGNPFIMMVGDSEAIERARSMVHTHVDPHESHPFASTYIKLLGEFCDEVK